MVREREREREETEDESHKKEGCLVLNEEGQWMWILPLVFYFNFFKSKFMVLFRIFNYQNFGLCNSLV